jgi:hypothetical protein
VEKNKGFLIVCSLMLMVVNIESFAQTDSLETIEAELDSEFLLEFSQSAEIKSEDLKITFVGVTSDSRCPADLTCALAGQADIEIKVQKGDNESTIILQISGDTIPEESFLNLYTIQALDLSPYPDSTKTINPDEYMTTVRISEYEESSNEPVLPPLKQVKLGQEPSCKEFLVLIKKYNGSPACVKQETAEELMLRGWAQNEI